MSHSHSNHSQHHHSRPHRARKPKPQPKPQAAVDLRQVAGHIQSLGDFSFSAGGGASALGNAQGTAITVEFLNFDGSPETYMPAIRHTTKDLQPARYRRAMVTVEHNGHPVQGIDFSISRNGEKEPFAAKTTDCNGQFIIDNLNDGKLNLKCIVPETSRHRAVREVYPGSNGNGHGGNGR